MARQMKYRPPPRISRRKGANGKPLPSNAPAPPTGAIAALFQGMGGTPGKTVAMH